MGRPATRRIGVFALVASTLAVAACGDGPSGPSNRTPTTLRIAAASMDNQTASIGVAVTVTPVVVVEDQTGAPMGGVTVRFTVLQGGGSVQNATAQTDNQGRASPGAWTLGATPGTNVLEATVEGLTPLRITATGESPYHINVRYIGTASAAQRAAVDFAINRWRSIVIRDLTDISMTAPANECFDGQPAFNAEPVDDLLIFIEFKPIDGVGKVLGQSGPCYIRTSNTLPIIGLLQLDNADLNNLEQIGLLNALIVHEIGHVLGFGTLWTERNLVTGVGTDPRFTGSAAVTAYRAAGGTAATVPIEDTGDPGTIDSHWRETVFRTELMTGFLNNGANPLSAVTIASLQDLGYTVSQTTAEPFSLSGGAASQSIRYSEAVALVGREGLVRPTHAIGEDGRRVPLRR